MNELIFAVSFIVLVVAFLQRRKIVNYLNYNFGLSIQSEIIVYILTFFFVILIIAGMLLDNTKEKYSKISESYDKLKPKPDNRPHRYFDINTYD
ncbi:hypothetical protein OAR97_04135 [Arcobacteraceae bacterium]|jgi:hypothetical protein|nr:hypothetical protein [Arcobacteraceae bacterium]